MRIGLRPDHHYSDNRMRNKIGYAGRAIALGTALTGAICMCGQTMLFPAGSQSAVLPDARGYAARGNMMANDANIRGAVDQYTQALRLLPEGEGRERELWDNTVASLAIPGTDAMGAVEDFIDNYPASPRRELAMLAIGDILYDRGEWNAALKAYILVDPEALNPSAAEDHTLHMGYCLLKAAQFDRARAMFESLTGTSLANDARFYMGYISYVKGEYADARRDFEAVDRAAGMPAAMADYYLAQIAYMRKDYKQAATLARRVAALQGVEPEFEYEALRVAGESLYEQGKAKEAMEYLDRYAAICPSPRISALYILGVEDYNQGRWKEAIERLTPVTEDRDVMGQSAYLFIGQSYMHLNNFNAAAMAFEKANHTGGDPKVQEAALYNLAIARMQGGKTPFGNSAGLLEEFLERFPNSEYVPLVADYLVKGYMNDNNYEAALEAIDKVQHPNDAVLAIKQMVLYSLGTRELQRSQPRAALGHLREASRMERLSPEVAAEATLWMGECQYKLAEYADAVKSYNSYLRQSSGSPRNRALAYYDLGYARFALKNFKDAKSDFRKFLKQPAGAEKHMIADAWNRLADCDYYTRNFTEAAENYREAYEANPQGGDYPVYQQGIMKGLTRNYEGKIETLNNLMTEFPGSPLVPTALLEIGESYGELGQEGRAVETYTALVSRYPSTDQGRQGQLMLAITYLNSGNRSRAIDHYRKVVEMYPSSEQARVAAEDLKQLYADEGRIDEYVSLMERVPDAPRIETAELAELTLQSAEKAKESGREADALRLATEVVERFPDSPQAVDALPIKAEAELAKGDAEAALLSYRALEQKASSAHSLNKARMGIMQVSRDMTDYTTALEMADLLLGSSALGASEQDEVAFTKALALNATGKGEEAVEIWKKLAKDPETLNGTKSALYLAQYHFDKGQNDKALKEINALIDANPPHDYWLARGFILLSDILRAKGETFEADEYLRSLKENYPGSEPDIFRMIDERHSGN